MASQPTNVDSRRRDGILALAGFGGLLAAGVAIVGVAPFLDPAVVALGVAGALGLEAAFVLYADRLLPLWERRGVPPASLLVVLVVGAVSFLYVPRLAGVLVWGFATYLALLAVVLAGVWEPSPDRDGDA